MQFPSPQSNAANSQQPDAPLLKCKSSPCKMEENYKKTESFHSLCHKHAELLGELEAVKDSNLTLQQRVKDMKLYENKLIKLMEQRERDLIHDAYELMDQLDRKEAGISHLVEALQWEVESERKRYIYACERVSDAIDEAKFWKERYLIHK